MWNYCDNLVTGCSTPCDSRSMLYRAIGHVISNTPLAAVVIETKKVLFYSEPLSFILKFNFFSGCFFFSWQYVSTCQQSLQLLPVLLDAISLLSEDILNKDMIYNLLLVFSGLLMDKHGMLFYIIEDEWILLFYVNTTILDSKYSLLLFLSLNDVLMTKILIWSQYQ